MNAALKTKLPDGREIKALASVKGNDPLVERQLKNIVPKIFVISSIAISSAVFLGGLAFAYSPRIIEGIRTELKAGVRSGAVDKSFGNDEKGCVIYFEPSSTSAEYHFFFGQCYFVFEGANKRFYGPIIHVDLSNEVNNLIK